MFELGEAVGVGHGGVGGGQTDRGKYNEMSDGSNIELGFSGEGKGAGKQEGRQGGTIVKKEKRSGNNNINLV